MALKTHLFYNLFMHEKFFFNFFLSQRTCTKELKKNVKKKNYFFLIQVKNHFIKSSSFEDTVHNYYKVKKKI